MCSKHCPKAHEMKDDNNSFQRGLRVPLRSDHRNGGHAPVLDDILSSILCGIGLVQHLSIGYHAGRERTHQQGPEVHTNV